MSNDKDKFNANTVVYGIPEESLKKSGFIILN